MKFKFCSDGDCPFWALAGLHALSSLPAPLFRTLVQQVMEEDQPDDSIMEILKDTSLSSREECARACACIRWVTRQAWSCACTGAALTRDLLVLGVPRAHAAALADALDAHRAAYEDSVKTGGFVINKVTDVSVAPGPPDSADTLTMSLFTTDITGAQKKSEVLIEKEKAIQLLKELKTAYSKMEELNAE
ncbi:COMM domain-containing protein 4 isoform X1 [Ostrinia nubilalis]|uniref:COMM domain-containing protein 4 isoform X1 n=1 Tax=Ostrinia nubilalis TaxID=29057 RepID=UPI0030822E01